MSEEKIIDELEEISQMVEGEDTVSVDEELQKIEELTNEEPQEEKKEEKEVAKTAATAEVAKKATEEKKEEKAPEKIEEKKPEKPAEIKPIKAPEKAIKPSNGFLYASAFLIIIGLIIYGLAFYLRWNGWRIVNNPPSSAVAIGGTLLILAGGEIYFRGKER